MIILIEEKSLIGHCIFTNQVFEIGRNATESLKSDVSVSRVHAKILVQIENNTPKITLTDLSSFGTFVNDKKLLKNAPYNVVSGNKIRFGTVSSIFRIEVIPQVVLTSNLLLNEKILLNEILTEFGDRLVEEFDANVTHLCSSSIKVTSKTALCLVHGVPIVNVEFFRVSLEWAKNRPTLKSRPNPADYIPTFAEQFESADEINFKPISARKALFSGLTFYMWSSLQLNKLQNIISEASGRSKLVEKHDLPKLLDSGSCVMKFVSDEDSMRDDDRKNVYKQVSGLMKMNRKRFVGDGEIIRAILFASIEKFCNPNCLDSSLMSQSSQTMDASQATAIRTNQPETNGRLKRKVEPTNDINVVLSELVDEKCSTSTTNKKSRLSVDADDRNDVNRNKIVPISIKSSPKSQFLEPNLLPKKIVIDAPSTPTVDQTSTSKRRRTDSSIPPIVNDIKEEIEKNIDDDVLANLPIYCNNNNSVVDGDELNWLNKNKTIDKLIVAPLPKNDDADDCDGAECKAFEKVRSNCVKSSDVPLICINKRKINRRDDDSSTKGFKKFTKAVGQLKKNLMEPVIGGSDFVPYGCPLLKSIAAFTDDENIKAFGACEVNLEQRRTLENSPDCS